MKIVEFLATCRNPATSSSATGIGSVTFNKITGDRFLALFAGAHTMRLIPARLSSLGLALLFLCAAFPGHAGTLPAPDTSPGFSIMCQDAHSTERFDDGGWTTVDDIQDYEANVFENWTKHGEVSGDPFVKGELNDITVVNQASDDNFWYYQVVTNSPFADSWQSDIFIVGSSIEMAFGTCSSATTRYELLVNYVGPSTDDVGTNW